MSMAHDELVHVIKNIVAQAVIEQRSSVLAHVSDYDPNQHVVRVIVPSMRDDQTGAPLHSGWLPFGSPLSGANSGVQVVPQGGATTDNPTAGELALVHLNERGTGVAAVSCLFYTAAQQPPNVNLSTKLQPGEIIVQQSSGTNVIFRASGDLDITTAGNGAVNIATSGSGTMSLTASGSGGMTLNASGSGAMVLESANPVQVKADLHVTGAVIAGFGGADQVGLQTHHGHQANSTIPPTPGT